MSKNFPFLMTYEDALRAGPGSVGGKAYSLAKLHSVNIPVPNGCVLPAGLWEDIYGHPDPNLAAALTADVVRNLLPSDRYVVRSSAVGEDSAEGSWAGCFDSVINVAPENLADAILTCGNSLHGRRVQVYRILRPNLAPVKKIGIVIQEYIPAQWNGVCFSANPVTGSREDMVVEFSRAEQGIVVDGTGIPETITIRRGTPVRCSPFAPRKQLEQLVGIVSQIEHHWGTPVDVEWLAGEDFLSVVQARPITTI